MAKATVVIHSGADHRKQENILCVVKFRGRNAKEVHTKVDSLTKQIDGAYNIKTFFYE